MISSADPIQQRLYMEHFLSAPESFWNTPNSDKVEVINGCGTKGLGDWLVPDHLYFLSILAACKVHDWCFAVWDDKPGFALSNDLFRNNMQRIVQTHFESTKMRWYNRFFRERRMKLSVVYYRAVCDLGERFYHDI